MNSLSSQMIAGFAVSPTCTATCTIASSISFAVNDSAFTIGPEVYDDDGIGLAAFGVLNMTCDVSGDAKRTAALSADLGSVGASPPLPVFAVPGQSLVLMFAGGSPDAVADAVAQADLGQSSSLMPDYIVTSRDCRWKGLGGLQAAGFWGNHWEWRPDTSYSIVPVEY